MNKNHIAGFLLALIFVLPAASHALPIGHGITYFNQSIGARSYGMGGAVTAAGGDGTFSFSNPAGLSGVQGTFFSIDSQNMTLLQAFQVSPGNIGIGLSSHYSKYDISSTSRYSYYNTYVSFLYAQSQGPFSFGGNFKYILSEEYKISSQPIKTGNGWDADLGMAIRLNNWLKAGAYIQNFVPFSMGGKNVWNNGSAESISMTARGGLAINLFGKNALFEKSSIRKMLLDLDVEVNSYYIFLGHAGLEWEIDGAWTLRAGIDQQLRQNRSVSVFTLGMGTLLDKWNVDIGYDPLISESAALSAYFIPEEIKRSAKETNFPSFNVASPQDNLVTDADFIMISGTARNTRVSVSGLNVFVNSDGSFSASVPLYMGKNLVEVTGTDDFGRRTVVQRKVLRKAKIVVLKEEKLEKKKADIIKVEETLLQKELMLATIEAKAARTAQEKKLLEKEKAVIIKQKEAIKEEKKKVESEVTVIQEKKTKVEALATLGVINAKEDAAYDIEERITRAELAMWLVKARGIPVYSVSRDLYPDVKKSDWAAPFIQAVVAKGLMSPYADGRFHPEDGVKESEGLSILKKFDKVK